MITSARNHSLAIELFDGIGLPPIGVIAIHRPVVDMHMIVKSGSGQIVRMPFNTTVWPGRGSNADAQYDLGQLDRPWPENSDLDLTGVPNDGE